MIIGPIIGYGYGFQLFVQSNNIKGEYADASARDAYFTANPSELTRLDQNQFLIIRLNDNGSGLVAYQQRASSNWVDVTSLIQGKTGPSGATGNSFFFTSLTDRDNFFNTSPNEGLLENGLPIVVNVGNNTTSQYIWAGPTAPIAYDNTLWRLSAMIVSSGTLFLGIDGANISSGANLLNFNSANGDTAYLHGVKYDDTGTIPPNFWEYSALSTIVIADVSGTALTDPQFLTITNTININIKEYTLIPATSGILRVQTWLAATEAGGPSLVDTYLTVGVGDIGIPTTYTVPNNTLIKTGQTTYTKFSGVQLSGGLQTSGIFVGQVKPYVSINAWEGTLKDFVIAPGGSDTQVQFNDNDTFGGSDNFTYDKTTNFVALKPDTDGTCSYNITNSLGVSKLILNYDEGTDNTSITTLTTDLVLTSFLGDIIINSTDVGININDPVSPLHIYENTSNTGINAGVRIQNAGTGDALLRFVAGTQTVTMGIDNSATDTFKIAMRDSFTADVAITIDSNENIITGGALGIEKTPVSPYVLDIKTFASEKVRLRDDKAVTIEAGSFGTQSTDLYFNRGGVGDNQSEFVISNSSNASIIDRFIKFSFTDTSGGLTIRRPNVVGIGTDTPNAALQFANVEQYRKIVLYEILDGDNSVYSFGVINDELRYQIPAATTSHTFYAGTSPTTSAEIFRIKGNGQVGVPDEGAFFAGTGEDLQITHDGTNSSIINSTGHFTIENTATDKDMKFLNPSGGLGDIWFQLGSDTDDTRFFCLNSSFQAIFFAEGDRTFNIPTGSKITIGDANKASLYYDSGNNRVQFDTVTGVDLFVTSDVIFDGTVYPDNVVGYIKNGETGFSERHIATGVFSSSTISLTATGVIYGAWWGKDGTRLYVTTDASYIYQYDLTVPYDISTATFTASNNFIDPNNTDGYTLWNNDGTVFWHGGRGSRKITLSTAWEVSGIASDVYFDASFRNPFYFYDLRWNFDGTKVLGVGDSLDQAQRQSFIEWECTTPYDFGTKTALDANIYAFPAGVPNGANIVKGFDISPDGKRVYLSAPSTGIEYEVVLETAWDLSSGTLVDTVTRTTNIDISNYSMVPDASGVVSVTAAGLIVQKKYGLAFDGKAIINGVDSNNSTSNLVTGLIPGGGVLSVNGIDDSLIDVSAGRALIADYSIPGVPSIREISWNNQTIDPVLGATQFIKWIGVQESATPGIGEFVFDIEFTQLEKRTIAIVGRCWGDGVTDSVTAVGQYTTTSTGQGYAVGDLSYVLGSMNKKGNVFSANGANLLLNKSGGITYRYSADYLSNPTSPNVHTDAAQIGLTPYWYMKQNALVADIQSTIDPNNWDDGGIKTLVPAGKYTLQRLYYYPVSQLLAPTYGQELFDSMGEAIGAAGEDLVINLPEQLLEGAILRGWIALKQGATALNDISQALFKEARSIGDQSAKGTVGTTLSYRNYTVADIGASGIHYYAGFYQAPASSVTLTIGGTVTQVYGIANIARGACAFCVASGPGGTNLVLTVSGTSITKEGVLTIGDSEVLVPDTGIATTNKYYQTTKLWLGQVTYTLTGATGSFTFNYGFAQYRNFSKRNFTVIEFSVIGQGAASETALDIQLMHHKFTGWTYSASSFVPGTGFIVSLANDYGINDNLSNGVGLNYERTNLSTLIDGENSEGFLVKFSTATNNSISSATIEVGALV